MKKYLFMVVLFLSAPLFAGQIGSIGGKTAAEEVSLTAAELKTLKENMSEDNFVYVRSLKKEVKTLSAFQTLTGKPGLVIQSPDGEVLTILGD